MLSHNPLLSTQGSLDEIIKLPLEPHWYALYTRSHCERLVSDQLRAFGFSVFLPELKVVSRRGGNQHFIDVPLFPGYLFLRHAMDKASYLQVRQARGLVRILGGHWDNLAVIPEIEIRSIQIVVRSQVPFITSPRYYGLKEGTHVRIIDGSLAGVEGIILPEQRKLGTGMLVLSVELLRRSIAIEIGITNVELIN